MDRFVEMVPIELFNYLIAWIQCVKTSKWENRQVRVTDSWLLHH